jgi:hypothetical protein
MLFHLEGHLIAAVISQVKKPYHLVRLSVCMKEDNRIWFPFYYNLMVKPF